MVVPWLLGRRRRRNAFHWHRDALVARGLVRHAPSRGRFRRDGYLPDPAVRNRLIDELRLAGEALQGRGGGRRLDAHAMFLSDMVTRGGLDKDLGVAESTGRRWRTNVDVSFLSGLVDKDMKGPWSERRRARREDPRIAARGSVPEPLRHTSEVLAGFVPRRSRRRGGGDGFDDIE
jgi:hypothetical protein